MVATSAGAMPPTLIFNLFRGFDVVALVTAPLLLGASPSWSLGLAGVEGVLGILRAEFENAMALTGCRSVAEIGPSLIAPAPWP